MKWFLFGAFGSAIVAFLLTGWGLVSKNKEDQETSKRYFLVVWVIAMALWIYGMSNSGINYD